VNVALTVAERAVFLEKGEVRFSGPTDELLRRPDILRSVYLQGTRATRSGRPRVAPEPSADADEPLLRASGLVKSFGGVQAVRGVSFSLPRDHILGIIGPNGAGKTSLFDLLNGFTRPDEGALFLNGEDVTSLGADQRAQRGLTRSFQDARLFPALTVTESLAVALEQQAVKSAVQAALHLPNVSRSELEISERVDHLLELFSMQKQAGVFVRELSTGQRRILDLACILANQPAVVLLDEPSSGIAQREAEELGPLLQRIQRETGCSMIVIEHDTPLLQSIADEFLALDLGAPIAQGRPADVLADERVIASYLGTSGAAINRSGQAGT
jgi:branched-chain amino acid transport system ATP-binding protein